MARKFVPGLPTTEIFSEYTLYTAGMYTYGVDYFEWFRDQQALDAATSEDWTNGGATRELSSWNTALFRAATKSHHQPINMYVIASGRPPLEVKVKAYGHISEGAKFLYYYSYAPEYASNEYGFSDKWSVFPAIAELNREIGAAEDLLVDAMPRRAQTAILYSTTHDIWAADVDVNHGVARMCTYLALRHAQVPVDVISEKDVHGDGLAGYKVIYAFGPQIEHESVEPLIEWVKRGGTLVLDPGALSRDQWNQPDDRIDRELGLARGKPDEHPAFYISGTIDNSLAPRGKVRLAAEDGSPGEEVDLLADSQPVAAKDAAAARTLATFADGTPAAVSVAAGQGRVVCRGFTPALAYMRGAVKQLHDGGGKEQVVHMPRVAEALKLMYETDRTWTDIPPKGDHSRQWMTGMPYRYNAGIRAFIVGPAIRAKVKQPVTLDAQPVDAAFLECDRGWVVPIANVSGAPIDKLTVTLDPGRPSATIRSSQQGELKVSELPDGRLRVTLPLPSTDMLYAEWAK
jgi:hypothetical protein